jgi:hypothetical protein
LPGNMKMNHLKTLVDKLIMAEDWGTISTVGLLSAHGFNVGRDK